MKTDERRFRVARRTVSAAVSLLLACSCGNLVLRRQEILRDALLTTRKHSSAKVQKSFQTEIVQNMSSNSSSSTTDILKSMSDMMIESEAVSQNINKRNLSLIVELRGELCNQLSVLTGAMSTKLRVEKNIPGVTVQLIGQHQNMKTWSRGRDDLVRCFSEFSDFEFEGGIWDKEFVKVKTLQKKWLQENETMLENVNNASQLEFLHSLLDQQWNNQPRVPPPETRGSRYSLPYLKASAFVTLNILDDEHLYDSIRKSFAFNESACCRAIPAPDETVFHFRNFQTELGPKHPRFNSINFVELSPHLTAQKLFGKATVSNSSHFTANSSNKVVLVSRYPSNLDPYVRALQEQGWDVRVLTEQTGVEDFCFLMKAPHTLVGPRGSTFTCWAGILGQSLHVRLYSTTRDGAEGRSAHFIRNRTFHYETYVQPKHFLLDVEKGRRSKGGKAAAAASLERKQKRAAPSVTTEFPSMNVTRESTLLAAPVQLGDHSNNATGLAT